MESLLFRVCAPPLETLENPGIPNLFLENWGTELAIGSYLNYLTLSIKKDWINVFCTIFNGHNISLGILRGHLKSFTALYTPKPVNFYSKPVNENCFVYFKYPRKPPGKSVKKSWKTLDFINCEGCTNLDFLNFRHVNVLFQTWAQIASVLNSFKNDSFYTHFVTLFTKEFSI